MGEAARHFAPVDGSGREQAEGAWAMAASMRPDDIEDVLIRVEKVLTIGGITTYAGIC